ncbi:4'-phosphopantetheinyl transferase family protein [uncultured Proteiniphilum sp.]|uniref:4'-phosphopantetheinyl transferase family protein n=1 Tax=uncultured Proteiniphilum sp. TaxID=497637 RepID=UPI00261A263C|nr:4'-phosphopantetheinyl transferase family protein [uncultured Proteiniphilum sp.]
MLIRREHTACGGLLGIWKMDESREELLLLLPEHMRSDAIEYVEGIRSERRTIEWLSTRILLFMLLDEEKTILNHADGKPYLEDGTHHISISHTKDYAAVLLHETYSVGIDIEIRSERVKKVAEKFIADEEYIDPSQKTVHQLLHWSAKESLFKLMEESGIHFRHHLHIHPFTPALKGIITATETKTDRSRTFNIHYEIHPDYVLTWVID